MTSSKRRRHEPRAAATLAAALLLVGCPGEQAAEVTVAEGVVFRRDTAVGAQTLTVDRRTAQVRPIVVAENLERRQNNIVGEARTVQEWARKKGAIAGVNAGFFGDTYDSLGRRKQLVQLCVTEGKVVAPGTPVGTALRSAIGFSGSGTIEIAWAVGTEQGGARRYEKPFKSRTGLTWRRDYAVACGPRLIHRSKIDVADRAEKLTSDIKVSRMAVAISERYLVFCRTDAMTYGELGRYLLRFYKETLHSAPTEAMCLDGGPSAQMVYQDGGSLKDIEPTGVQVPTAILLVPSKN